LDLVRVEIGKTILTQECRHIHFTTGDFSFAVCRGIVAMQRPCGLWDLPGATCPGLPTTMLRHKLTISRRLLRFAHNSGKIIDAYAQLTIKIFAFVALLFELVRALLR
jgi:hypothetical protein